MKKLKPPQPQGIYNNKMSAYICSAGFDEIRGSFMAECNYGRVKEAVTLRTFLTRYIAWASRREKK